MNSIRFGYAAITWGNEERRAADDIAAAGYPGIQFRANAVTEFKPAELKELLAQHKLTFVALSGGKSRLMSRRQNRSQNTLPMRSSSKIQVVSIFNY
jgi:sugar phosphate isomerase/epimerase